MTPQIQASSPVSFPTQGESPLRMTNARRDSWLRHALELRYPDYRDPRAWAEFRAASADLASENLSPEILEALQRFFSPAGGEYLLIENLPVDPNLPEVPHDGKRPAGKQTVSEAVIVGLIGRRAEILAYTNEKGGSPIHELAPVSGLEMTQSNGGRIAMDHHTDGAFLPRRFRPQGLLLYGLLNVDTATLITSAQRLMDAASADLLDVLEKPWYRHAPPVSFSCSAASPPGPVLWRDENGAACVAAASSAIEPVNAAAREALSEFRQLCAEVNPVRIVINPGTALLFRNDRVLHGRQAVSGRRWLQRAYFTDSLDTIRKATNAGPGAFSFDASRLLELC